MKMDFLQKKGDFLQTMPLFRAPMMWRCASEAMSY
jgi:hypothetical protein